MAPPCSPSISGSSCYNHTYIILGSKKMTGFGSRMDASSRPLASRGLLGITTCRLHHSLSSSSDSP